MEIQKNKYMEKAVRLAEKAFKKGEIPIGAIVVKADKIIGMGYNKRNKSKNATEHAEIVAISKACKKIGDWRLEGCDLYVTTVPCPMCAGACVNARLRCVYFGATNENFKLFEEILIKSSLNHVCDYEGGILQDMCSNLLKSFFKSKR